jgi:hypothetical protein
MLGAGLGPDPTLGVPAAGAEGAGDVLGGVTAVAIGFARGLARFVDTLMVGSVWAFRCVTTGDGWSETGGTLAPPRVSGGVGVGDCACALCGNIVISAHANANRRHPLDTSAPPIFV